MKIMIVDDSRSFRLALRHLLEKNKKYEIICEAENGRQALDLMNSFVPEIVLMDIEMPIMDGLKAAKLMLWENSKIKFIAITMYRDKAYLDEIMSAGFRACIFKSDVYDEIYNVIDVVSNNNYLFPKNMKIKNKHY